MWSALDDSEECGSLPAAILMDGGVPTDVVSPRRLRGMRVAPRRNPDGRRRPDRCGQPSTAPRNAGRSPPPCNQTAEPLRYDDNGDDSQRHAWATSSGVPILAAGTVCSTRRI